MILDGGQILGKLCTFLPKTLCNFDKSRIWSKNTKDLKSLEMQFYPAIFLIPLTPIGGPRQMCKLWWHLVLSRILNWQ